MLSAEFFLNINFGLIISYLRSSLWFLTDQISDKVIHTLLPWSLAEVYILNIQIELHVVKARYTEGLCSQMSWLLVGGSFYFLLLNRFLLSKHVFTPFLKPLLDDVVLRPGSTHDWLSSLAHVDRRRLILAMKALDVGLSPRALVMARRNVAGELTLWTIVVCSRIFLTLVAVFSDFAAFQAFTYFFQSG